LLETILTLLVVGYASAYSPGVFEEVIHVRQNNLTAYPLPRDLEIDRYIAVEDCSHIGKEALVFFDDQYERVLIADCAGIADGGRAWMQRNNIAGELDWDTFSEYKINQPLEIRVYLIENLKYKYQ
jgi:hypothetical protein